MEQTNDPSDQPSDQHVVTPTPEAGLEASRFKLSLNAKGLVQYEVSFGYTSPTEMLMRAVADARAFDALVRQAFPNVVPAALNGQHAHAGGE